MASDAVSFAIFAYFALFVIPSTLGHPVRYDQRQEGDLNIRTDVEDVVLVVVPPKDLVTAGMGIVAASAASLLKKNYVSDIPRPERWHYKPHTKWNYAYPDMTPLKIDLGKPEFHKKKVVHHGDPNRYNIHDGKVPVKSSSLSEPSGHASVEGDKLAMMPTTIESMVPTATEKPQMESGMNTEGKTVKKDLTNDDMKELASMVETNTKRVEDTKFGNSGVSEPKVAGSKIFDTKATDAQFADSKFEGPKVTETKMTDTKGVGTKIPDTKFSDSKHSDAKASAIKFADSKAPETQVSETKLDDSKVTGVKFSDAKVPDVKNVKKQKVESDDVPRVLGELSPGSLGPTSIFSHEGCGPDAFRDIRGICIYRKETSN